jgi:radical SAM superfamily enzyme YgiQ (UPF0313 family)
LSVLFVVPAQYSLDAPPPGRRAPAGGSEIAPPNVVCEPFGDDVPITCDYGYLYYYAAPYLKSLIESVEGHGCRFRVTVVDEEFPPTREPAGDGRPPVFDGFLGTAEEIRTDAEKSAFLDRFDILALTGQLHQIPRAHELAALARDRGLAVLWGGVGVTALYLETHPRVHGHEPRHDPADPLTHAWEEVVTAADSVVVGEASYQALDAEDGGGTRRSVLEEALADLIPVVGEGAGGPAPSSPRRARVHDEFFRQGFLPGHRELLPLAAGNREVPPPDYGHTPARFLHNVPGAQYRLGCRFNCSFCIVTRVQRQRDAGAHRKRELPSFLREVEDSLAGVGSRTLFFIDDDFFGIPIDDLLRLSCFFGQRGLDYVVQGDVHTILTLRDAARVIEQPGSGEVWALVRPQNGTAVPLLAADGREIRHNTVFRVDTATSDLVETILDPPDFEALWHRAPRPMFEHLAAHGLSLIFLGLETLDPDELATLGKGTFQRVEKAHDALAYLRSLQVLFVANMIVGTSGQGKGARYAETLIRLGVPLATVFVLTAYPGTPLWAAAKKEGTLFFPWDTMGMDAFKFFDTMRGNVFCEGFDIYAQRDEALALNRVLFSDASIRRRMAPYLPRLSARNRGRRRLEKWFGMLFHNFYYQRNVDKGLNAPYAGGLDREEIPLVVEKAVDCAIGLLLEHALTPTGAEGAPGVRGWLERLAERLVVRPGLVRYVSGYYDSYTEPSPLTPTAAPRSPARGGSSPPG